MSPVACRCATVTVLGGRAARLACPPASRGGWPVDSRPATTPRLYPAERARLAVMAAVIILLNACGWAIFVFTVMPHNFHYARLGVGLGVAVTAWTLGLRHAFDAEDRKSPRLNVTSYA